MTRELRATGFLWGARAVVRAALARRFPERLGAPEGWKLSFLPGNRGVSEGRSVSLGTETNRDGTEKDT